MINEENIDDLLAKYLAEETDSNEAEQVSEWIGLSDENQKVFEHSSLIWEKSKALHGSQSVDVDAAWAKLGIEQFAAKQSNEVVKPIIPFNAKIGGSNERLDVPKSIPQNLIFKNFLKFAATLAFVFGTWFLVSKNMATEPELLTFKTAETPTEKVLADGTKVFLNKNSSISFPEKFEGDIRNVKLTGEAFFEVHHDAAHPFIIDAQGSQIKVLGTSFNVKAYNEQVQVAVRTGKVQFSSNEKQVILVKGEAAAIEVNQAAITKMTNIDENILAYKTQSLTFQEASLEKVVASLSDIYGKKISFENEKIKHCSLTATFDHENLDNILTIISETLNLKVRKQGDSIVLSGEGCQ